MPKKMWELNAYEVPMPSHGPDVMLRVVTEWDREANGWRATANDELVFQGRPNDSQAMVAIISLSKRLGVAREDPELVRAQAIDLELATAMLLDLCETKNDPSAPLSTNPMRSMLARLCRGVLRAHGKDDPTGGIAL